MAGKVILAVAGAGKTYAICQMIDKHQKNLILAFTHENIKNIENELIRRFKRIPNKTFVMTFHSFMHQFLLKPYEFSLFKCFGEDFIETRGVSFKTPPSKSCHKGNRYYKNPYYIPVNKIGHYITSGREYYCDLMSEAFMRMDDSVTSTIISNFSLFFDNIYVDEFQDFRNFDYELLMKLCKICQSVTMVGDYYQHSVSGVQNSGKPFKKGKEYVNYNEFIENMVVQEIAVDSNTLQNSYRCSEEVCTFIREKLGIDIKGNKERLGQVKIIESFADEEIQKIIFNDNIMKLVYNKSSEQCFKCLNWSYSKGDTFLNTCVILPNSMSGIIKERQVQLSDINRNLLYVALTRSTGNVFLLTRQRLKEFLNNNSLCI